MRPIATLRCGYLKCVSPTGCKPSRSGAVLGPGAAASRGTLPGAMHHAPVARTQSPPNTMVARSCDFAIASPFPAFHAGCGGRLAQRLRAHAEQLPPQIRGYDSRDINTPRALTRDTRPRKRLSMPGETTRRDLRERRPGTPRNPCVQRRETRPHGGRVSRAFGEGCCLQPLLK